MNVISLDGCRPQPLAHYLKALGVFRLVAEGTDTAARGRWSGDVYVLETKLSIPDLRQFFLSRYQPTPIVGPWNGGSGFYPNDNQDGIGAIEQSTDPRFAAYRATIATARRVLARRPDAEKDELVSALRAELPDAAVAWIDSALALTASGLRFPPLLGTGGNDGRLEFTNNLMMRLARLFLDQRPAPESWLDNALFGSAAPDLVGAAVGQFLPASAGGANLGPGFSADARVNPWDFVLMLEGALLFAGAVTRRFESTNAGGFVYPFTVRSTGAGYGSAASSDEADTRNEVWLPLWTRAASLDEVRALFAEGRAKVATMGGARDAVTGVDFARAIANLGVDRGIASFERYGFHQRNGLSYLAAPLGRWRVRHNPDVDLLAPIDEWLRWFRIAATADRAPASVRRALGALERSIFDLCGARAAEEAGAERVAAVLVALGSAEGAICRSPKYRTDSGLRPVPTLPAVWRERTDDGSSEWRIAAALAASGIRDHLVPVRNGRWWDHDDGRIVWGAGDLVANLGAIARRRALDRVRSAPIGVPVGDVAAFVDGGVDDARITDLIRGLSLVAQEKTPLPAGREDIPPYTYVVCALAHHRYRPGEPGEAAGPLPATPAVLARLLAGDLGGAVFHAQRRLRSAGLRLRAPPTARPIGSPVDARRLAAALALPLESHACERLVSYVAYESSNLESTS